MYQLAVFDLDNTLAPLGKGISEKNLELLQGLEERGLRIALCSGKPVYYLCGFLRQAGLKAPILSGENGAIIQFGVDLPPKQRYELPVSKAAKAQMQYLRRKIEEALPQLWYQPNQAVLTPFPVEREEFETIERILQAEEEQMSELVVFRHSDSFDIVPRGIDKGAGLRYLAELLHIGTEDVIAIGDETNDYPMFEAAGLALGVNVRQEDRVDRNFLSTEEMLRYLYTLV